MLLNILYFIQLISSSDLGTKTKIKVETVTTDKPGNDTGNNTETGTGTNTETDNIKKAILFTNYEYNDRNLAIMKQLIFETTIWPAFVSYINTKDISEYEPKELLLFFVEKFRKTIINCFRNLNLNISFTTLNDDLNFDEESISCKNDCFLCYAISENDIDHNANKFLCPQDIFNTLKRKLEGFDDFRKKDILEDKFFKDIFNFLYRLNIDCKRKKNVENKFFFGFYISCSIIKDLFYFWTDLTDVLDFFKCLKNLEISAVEGQKDLLEEFLQKSSFLLSIKNAQNNIIHIENTLKYFEKIFKDARQTETQHDKVGLDFCEKFGCNDGIKLILQDINETPLKEQTSENKTISIQNQVRSTLQSEIYKKSFSENFIAGGKNTSAKDILYKKIDDLKNDKQTRFISSPFNLFTDNITEAFETFEKISKEIINLKRFKLNFLLITPKILYNLENFSIRLSKFNLYKNYVFPFFLNDLSFEIVTNINEDLFFQNYIKQLEIFIKNYEKVLKLINCDPCIVSKNLLNLQKKSDLCFFIDNYYLNKSNKENSNYELSLIYNKIFFNAIQNHDHKYLFCQKLEFKKFKNQIESLNCKKENDSFVSLFKKVFIEKKYEISPCLIENCKYCNVHDLKVSLEGSKSNELNIIKEREGSDVTFRKIVNLFVDLKKNVQSNLFVFSNVAQRSASNVNQQKDLAKINQMFNSIYSSLLNKDAIYLSQTYDLNRIYFREDKSTNFNYLLSIFASIFVSTRTFFDFNCALYDHLTLDNIFIEPFLESIYEICMKMENIYLEVLSKKLCGAWCINLKKN